MGSSSTKIPDLRKNVQYRVQQDFTDFYHNRFVRGELLTFVETHFLPYHGGYTVVFKEKTLYLQEDADSAVLASLEDYLRLASK